MAERGLSLSPGRFFCTHTMILNSLDEVSSFYDPDSHLRLTFATVTDTARALERSHLCGPIAGVIQAEFVGAATLLGTLLDGPGQTISLRVNFPDGQLGGATIECASGFLIRGYTRQKVLPQLDDSDAPNDALFDRALGRRATCGVVRTLPNAEPHLARFDVSYQDHLSVTDIVEEYFCTSLQQRALAQLSASSRLGYVACAHALLCDFQPEASEETYARIERLFAFGRIQDAIDSGASVDALARMMGLGNLQCEHTQKVRFYCGCSADRVLTMLRTLSPETRREMIAAGKPTDIYCHMCGKCYTITPEQLAALD